MNIRHKKLIKLRKKLHKNAELSGKEVVTSRIIEKYLLSTNPDELITKLGGNGLAAVFNGIKDGPSILFRCELDALPIMEQNDFNYQSKNTGVSHKCGHDGHMTIMAGLAELISNDRPGSGKVILLFQPAEETGVGALKVLEDPKFRNINPDYVFALHNLPGYPLNKILIKDNVFAAASIGLCLEITGRTSHASEPEKGNNPSMIVADILKKIQKYSLPGANAGNIKLITPVYTRVGEKALGTSAGEATMMFTLRATKQTDFEDLKNFLLNTVSKSIVQNSSPGDFKLRYTWAEEFPATVNNKVCNNFIKQAALKSNLELEKISFPFRWSEDFGHFLIKFKGALFGIGSGIDKPALHNPDYDFPDELIHTGSTMFYNIYRSFLIR